MSEPKKALSLPILPNVPEPEPGAPDYTQRVMQTYMVGVYVAVNAVRDLFLLVEGPDCAYMKTQNVQGNHDWLSTVTSVSGFHRITTTALHPSQMAGSREESLIDTMRRLASHKSVPALMVTTMPLAFVTGADYDRLGREVGAATGKAILNVPGKSLSGDWMDGYAETLNSFATQLDLTGGSPSPEKVAVVGYLYDRNEGDHEANVVELKRMLRAVGLDPVSVWLSGGRFEELGLARDAGTIISLPYGRKAARKLAKRQKARLIELDLPFGLEASERFMRTLGEAVGKQAEAEAFIDAELSTVVPKLEWVIPYLFMGRNWGYVGDPHLAPGLCELARSLGANLRFAALTNDPRHAVNLQARMPGVELLVYPKMKSFIQFVHGHVSKDPTHLLITNNMGVVTPETAIYEFGFPCMFRHALAPQPFLGFMGALAFVDGLANAVRWNDVLVSMPGRHTGLPQSEP